MSLAWTTIPTPRLKQNTRRDNPFRAYLTIIIEGRDKARSYYVVPFTRGPERSRLSASVLEEVRRWRMGYSEIQLLDKP